MLTEFNRVSFAGEMGDPTGTKTYRSLNKHPVNKWQSTLNNPIRKFWMKQYLNWIGAERLSHIGYDLELLQDELSSVKLNFKGMPTDIARMIYGWIYTNLKRYFFERHVKMA
jgi:hypothetical protein